VQLNRPARAGCYAHTRVDSARQPHTPGARPSAHQDEPICCEYLNRHVLRTPHEQLRRRHRDRTEARVARPCETVQHGPARRQCGAARAMCTRARGHCFRAFRGSLCGGGARCGFRGARRGFRGARGACLHRGGGCGSRVCRRRTRLCGAAGAFATTREHDRREQRKCRGHAKPAQAPMFEHAHQTPTKRRVYWIHRLVASTRPGRSSTRNSAGSATIMPTTAPAINAVPGTAT
jgi:hypothetical protein